MRKIVNINQGWKFIKQDVGAEAALQAEGEQVNIPHTWNNIDGQDGGDDYYRGKCWYVTSFEKPETEEGGRVFLEFKGVNASSMVYVNGDLVAVHANGYSTFRADVTEKLKEKNDLVVLADNSKTEEVYPQTADFTFYGGIYRDVNIITVSKEHFDLTYYGGPGIMVTPTVKEGNGVVTVQAWANEGEIEISILDADGNEVAKGKNEETLTIENAKLWDGLKSPYLYKAVARLIVGGEVKDEICAPCGFRTFRMDPQKGFFLNGRPYPLRGVCRHQDRKGLGNAITKAEHDEDMQLILEVGANTIRLAHYQHDDYFYDLCDKYGLVIWAEIPYISRHMPEANENTDFQMRELIYQQYNHPSIVTWGVSNEITMFPKHRKDMLENHYRLNDLCHKLDPTRPTTLACYAMCGPFNKVATITDIVSWNLYLGWYVPGLFLNDVWFWLYHATHPNRCLGMSEYGAEGMPNLHSVHPKRGDNTEEYQIKYHEYMVKFFASRDYVWASHIWNMFDFAADARNQGGEPGMNHKGLVTFDRKTKKDSFYLYKAYWSEDPFIHLCGKRFVNRTGKKLQVKVYTNQPKVALYVNGKLIEEKTGDKVFNFTLPMSEKNEIEVRAGELTDSGTVISVNKPDPSYSIKMGKNVSWQV